MTPEERFWSKVDRSGECWVWTGAKGGNGYGRVRIQTVAYAAHRVSYAWLIGPIPEGLELDHLCGTPACVRPAHLEAVTHAENMRRSKSARKTSCKLGHAMTGPNVYVHRGARSCRKCRRLALIRFYERQAA